MLFTEALSTKAACLVFVYKEIVIYEIEKSRALTAFLDARCKTEKNAAEDMRDKMGTSCKRPVRY